MGTKAGRDLGLESQNHGSYMPIEPVYEFNGEVSLESRYLLHIGVKALIKSIARHLGG